MFAAWGGRAAATLAILAVWSLPARAVQETLPEQQKLLAKRAAEADAFRKLAEAVYGVKINARTTVRDFVTESDAIRSDVDTMIRGIRLAEPRYLSDGSCEVEAEVTVAKVVETIRETHQRHYDGDDVTQRDFEAITRNTQKDILKVIGMGAPRADIPAELPLGVAELLGPPPSGSSSGDGIPELWRRAGPQARLMAIRAARVDALRRLAERIKGLRLTSSTRVRDFAAESDVISTDLQAELVGAQEVQTYLHHNELIAEVTLRVPTEQVIKSIRKLHSKHIEDDDEEDAEITNIENVARSVIKRDFEATGMGVPPVDMLRRFAQSQAPQIPEWAMAELSAAGDGVDPDRATPQGRLRAARAAELDARRKLAEQIGGLQIRTRTVRDFLSQHTHVTVLVDALVSDALVTATEFDGGRARVTISVPGMELWGMIHEEQRRQDR